MWNIDEIRSEQPNELKIKVLYVDEQIPTASRQAGSTPPLQGRGPQGSASFKIETSSFEPIAARDRQAHPGG
jgi:hypothetical protein